MFHLELHLRQDYPYIPPGVYFTTKVFHPNIDNTNGKVCMDRLAENWKPTFNLKSVCIMVQCLLGEPNPDSPLNGMAARMLQRNNDMYDRTVLMWVKVHANGIHSYDPYNQELERLSQKCGDIDQALKLLTRTNWDLEAATERLL